MYYNSDIFPRKCSHCGSPMNFQAASKGTNNQFYSDFMSPDHGKEPFALNLSQAAKQNNTYRTVIWTGEYLQVTLMSIDVGDDIGLEVHPEANQFTYIVDGQGLIEMGNSKEDLNYDKKGSNGFAMIVPAGTWHNITNTGDTSLKMYTIYAPPLHPFGAVEKTKGEAEAREGS